MIYLSDQYVVCIPKAELVGCSCLLKSGYVESCTYTECVASLYCFVCVEAVFLHGRALLA
jgi:hypothetical protein